MSRIGSVLYGFVSYAIFFATFLYLLGFLANAFVPYGIDAGAPSVSAGGLALAFAIDAALIALFGLQHSVMARPGFKRGWTRIVPAHLERSTYVLASSLALIVLFAAWRPIPIAIWDLESPHARALAWALFVSGFGLVLYATFLIDHFDLFGLRQVARFFQSREHEAKRFMTPGLYKLVRHPIYVGWLITFWATPTLTVGHALLAAGMTAYILIAIPFEERDLEAALGEPYRRYRETTPMLVPGFARADRHRSVEPIG